jgi:alanine racemase
MTSAPPEGADPTSTCVLTIDLGALRTNYRALRDLAPNAECAAVIKANAYGIGARQAARALSRGNCKTFFVATFSEAQTVRKMVKDATIYVLDGFFSGSGPAFSEAGVRPVLSSLMELEDWASFCKKKGAPLPAAIQLDTGMNRLGLSGSEVEKLSQSPDTLQAFTPALLMSHLACGDEPENPMNEAQLKTFEKWRALVPSCPASFANSAGIALGEKYHFDLTRAGFALYGGRSVTGQPPLQSVVQLHTRITQIHEAEAGEKVGYGAEHTLKRKTRIATISLGYADGIFRCLGATDGNPGLSGTIEGHTAPVLGRVSMDLITLDVTDIPSGLATRGSWVEILGSHTSVDDLAIQAGSIGYEVLTSLSRRAQRIYVDSESGTA